MKKSVIFSILLTSLSIAKPISIDYLNLKKRATAIGSKGKIQLIKAGKFVWDYKVEIAIAGLYYYAAYSLGKHIGNKIINKRNLNDNTSFSQTSNKSTDSTSIPGQCPRDSQQTIKNIFIEHVRNQYLANESNAKSKKISFDFDHIIKSQQESKPIITKETNTDTSRNITFFPNVQKLSKQKEAEHGEFYEKFGKDIKNIWSLIRNRK